jgi:hypothetical protein
MGPTALHVLAYGALRYLQYACLGLIVAASLQHLCWATPHGGIEAARTWIEQNTKAVTIVLTAVLTACATASRVIGEPWLIQCITSILDEFQSRAFTGPSGFDSCDEHRVTLYRFKRVVLLSAWSGCEGPFYWPWGRGNRPWSGWLVPLIRVGPSSPPRTIWLANSERRCHGVCGAAFFGRYTTLEKKSPELPDISNEASPDQIRAYAQKTWVSEATIKKRIAEKRPCARYYLAHRVQVGRKRWGVLLIDSRAECLPKVTENKSRFSQINDVLGHLLARV